MTTYHVTVGFYVWASATNEIEAASPEEARDVALGRSRDGRYLWDVNWDCGGGGDSVTVERGDKRWDYPGEDERLRGAAPGLVRALKEALGVLDNARRYASAAEDREAARCALETARAAIAEATGEACDATRDASSCDVLVTVESGLVRSVLVDCRTVSADVRHYDVEGCDDPELSRDADGRPFTTYSP